MFALGEWTGVGFYGLTLLLAVFFLAASAWYFLQTRWYLFPALYLNFGYFADRFVYRPGRLVPGDAGLRDGRAAARAAPPVPGGYRWPG